MGHQYGDGVYRRFYPYHSPYKFHDIESAYRNASLSCHKRYDCLQKEYMHIRKELFQTPYF